MEALAQGHAEVAGGAVANGAAPPAAPPADQEAAVGEVAEVRQEQAACEQPKGEGDGAQRDAELEAEIMRQVNFYFSDQNVVTDDFLLKHIRSNPDGYVPIKVIASFNKMKKLTRKFRVISDALRQSPELEVSADGQRVRRRAPLIDVDLDTVRRCTVIADNLPEKPTIEQVMGMFGVAGEVAMVRIRKPDQPEPLLTKGLRNEVTFSNKTYALVEYSTPQQAQRAVEMLNDATNWRTGLRVRPLLREQSGRAGGAQGRQGRQAGHGVGQPASHSSGQQAQQARQAAHVPPAQQHAAAPAAAGAPLAAAPPTPPPVPPPAHQPPQQAQQPIALEPLPPGAAADGWVSLGILQQAQLAYLPQELQQAAANALPPPPPSAAPAPAPGEPRRRHELHADAAPWPGSAGYAQPLPLPQLPTPALEAAAWGVRQRGDASSEEEEEGGRQGGGRAALMPGGWKSLGILEQLKAKVPASPQAAPGESGAGAAGAGAAAAEVAPEPEGPYTAVAAASAGGWHPSAALAAALAQPGLAAPAPSAAAAAPIRAAAEAVAAQMRGLGLGLGAAALSPPPPPPPPAPHHHPGGPPPGFGGGAPAPPAAAAAPPPPPRPPHAHPPQEGQAQGQPGHGRGPQHHVRSEPHRIPGHSFHNHSHGHGHGPDHHSHGHSHGHSHPQHPQHHQGTPPHHQGTPPHQGKKQEWETRPRRTKADYASWASGVGARAQQQHHHQAGAGAGAAVAAGRRCSMDEGGAGAEGAASGHHTHGGVLFVGPTRQPTMPDGTRGFALGRGRAPQLPAAAAPGAPPAAPAPAAADPAPAPALALVGPGAVALPLEAPAAAASAT